MGESAGPAGPVDGAEIRGTLPGYFGGNLGGGRIRAGWNGSRLGVFQFAQRLRETVAVSG